MKTSQKEPGPPLAAGLGALPPSNRAVKSVRRALRHTGQKQPDYEILNNQKSLKLA
jgi:hypothetical protein